MESINFVIKRYMTSAIKKTTDEILVNCTSVMYKFTHPIALARNRDDLNERYMSLLMGYPYPYTVREQPRHLRHLSLDVVIPFLKRHLREIQAYGDAQENNESADKQNNFWATSQERELKNSKIVQGVFALLTNPEVGRHFSSNGGVVDGDNSATRLAVSFIEVWYTKWLQGLKNDNMSASLTADIKSFLLEIRYWKEDHVKHGLGLNVRKWSTIANKWAEAGGALDSFYAFVKQHCGQLVGNAPLTPEQSELRPKKVNCEALPCDGNEAEGFVMPRKFGFPIPDKRRSNIFSLH